MPIVTEVYIHTYLVHTETNIVRNEDLNVANSAIMTHTLPPHTHTHIPPNHKHTPSILPFFNIPDIHWIARMLMSGVSHVCVVACVLRV